MKKINTQAYKLKLFEKYNAIHSIFHVSLLKFWHMWWEFKVANYSYKKEREMRDEEDNWSANQEKKDWVFSSMSWFIFLRKLLRINEKS